MIVIAECAKSLSFGTSTLKEGMFVTVDSGNLYIQALLDNGLLRQVNTKNGTKMEYAERTPALHPSCCGLLGQSC